MSNFGGGAGCVCWDWARGAGGVGGGVSSRVVHMSTHVAHPVSFRAGQVGAERGACGVSGVVDCCQTGILQEVLGLCDVARWVPYGR